MILTLIFYPFVWLWSFFESAYSVVFYSHTNWSAFHHFENWLFGFILLIPMGLIWVGIFAMLGASGNSPEKEELA